METNFCKLIQHWGWICSWRYRNI